MILVTLGTQDKGFPRLLKTIDEAIERKEITDKVIVQAGNTIYQSKNMEIIAFLSMEDFEKYIRECDLLITHAGVGSIVTGLKNNKKVIAVPRLKKYHEHTNDHQKQIAEEMAKKGYLLYLENMEDLGKLVKQAHNFKPHSFESNNAKFINFIKDYIDNN